MKRKRSARRLCAALPCLIILGACGGSSGIPTPAPPPPPALASLAVSGDANVNEAGNPKIELKVELNAPASDAVSVDLNFAGTATRDSDYAVENDSVMISAGASSASTEIDAYRDFEGEGDETIEVSLGTITGNARAGSTASVTITLLDGEAAAAIKRPDGEDEGGDIQLDLLPLAYTVTEDAVQFAVAATLFIPPPHGAFTETLVAEWSTDPLFETDLHEIGRVEVMPTDDPFDLFFGNLHVFSVPTSDLAPDETYYLRAYLGPPPPVEGFGGFPDNVFFDGFATDSEGRVRVRCEAPQRSASNGDDPLYFQQWHLANTGQTAFSDRGGTFSADLQMNSAIAAGRGGEGVKIAVIDTGLETCHPDLAANAAGRGSHNFAWQRLGAIGARADEPYNFGVLGDHGTSVAGVAAAAASNGLGGRGVAPDATLVGFNPMEASIDEEDGSAETPAGNPFEGGPILTAMLESLGASESAPDSASVDIFNMSFGSVLPGENSSEEFERLFRMGTGTLRGGLGALYVKAAGNDFDFCRPIHPLNAELGCISANSDPDQNLPWLISTGGFNADDVRSSYSSAGANLWIVGPSGEDGEAAPSIITTDQAGTHGGFSEFPENRLNSANPLNTDGDYVSAFGGTSSAAPAVAGAIAILLGVNPDLTWRDIKHILATTARPIDPARSQVRAAFNGKPYVAQHAWRTNAAGYSFHNWYGFGAFHVDAAVEQALSHMPDSLGALTESDWMEGAGEDAEPLGIPDADGAGVSATLEVSGLPDTASLEAVVLEISIDHPFPADIGITLRSPGGMESVVNPPFNAGLADTPAGIVGWRLLSNAFYGENPNGTWTVHLADLAAGDVGSLGRWRLRFYHGEHL